jgi:anti-sigma28 factor (negative regulator of flagellin synthesis)
MKINDGTDAPAVRNVVQPLPARKATKAPASESSTMEAPASRKELTIQAARQAAGQRRAARLEEIKAQLNSGSYQPSASEIASRILASAELDARLRVVLTFP